MDTRRLRIGTAAAAVLLAVAATAACDGSGGGSGGGPAGGAGRRGTPTPKPSPTVSSASAPASPSTAARTAPAAVRTTTAAPVRTDTAACFDGSCEISVAKPTTIRVDSHRFGFSSFRITRVDASGVTVEARSGGTYLQSGVSPGGTAALNGLKVRLTSVRDGVADLVLSAR